MARALVRSSVLSRRLICRVPDLAIGSVSMRKFASAVSRPVAASQPQLLTEDEVIAALPPWTSQITVRGFLMGVLLGAIFSFITMRFSLGPGGVVPTFNMPTGDKTRLWPANFAHWSTQCGISLVIISMQSSSGIGVLMSSFSATYTHMHKILHM